MLRNDVFLFLFLLVTNKKPRFFWFDPPPIAFSAEKYSMFLMIKGHWIAGILLVLTMCHVAGAADSPPMRIGIHEKPPYATRNAKGEWDGLGVQLWKDIAEIARLRFEFVEMPFEQILPAIGEGRLDAAVGEFTITADGEQAVRFTQPYLISSAGAAMHTKIWRIDWKQIAGEFISWPLALVLLAILAGIFLVSFCLWVIERHHQVGHFRGGLQGFGSALWFSASTVTGVGYGDKIPATFIGRMISFVWMLMGVLLVAGFTATVASSMSAARISDSGRNVEQLGDLRHYSCGVMRGSFTEQILIRDGIDCATFETYEEAFQALNNDRIETVIGDKICLRYYVKQWAQRKPPVHFVVSSVTNENIFIGIPVRPGLPEYHEINMALLRTIYTEAWQGALRRWLGEVSN